MVVVDHKPLVALYSSHSRSLSVHLVRQKLKVACFDFNVVYEPGRKIRPTTDQDIKFQYVVILRQRGRIKESKMESDEILIHCCEELLDAVTIPI